MQKNINRFSWFLVLLTTIAFCLKNTIEPDIWWQLAAGNWMLDHGTVLVNDPFSFTFYGTNWINIKWGYELLLAIFTGIFSPELVPVTQAMVSCVLVYFVVRTARLFLSHDNKAAGYLAGFTGVLFMLLAGEHRMNSRPEMFTHLFTVIFIFLLSLYEKKKSKSIYWLIPIQLLWANLHDGYVVGLMLVLIYIVICWLRIFFSAVHEKPWAISLVGLGMVLANCINPYGYKLLFKTVGIFNQIKETKYTTEFLDYNSYQFWTWQSYLVFSVFIIVVMAELFRLFRAVKPEMNSSYIAHILMHERLVSLAFVGAFFALALLAYRNIIFLAIVIAPLSIEFLQFLTVKIKPWFLRRLQLLLIIVYAVLYFGIVSNYYYTITKSRNHFGLEIPSTKHPVQTANFLSASGVHSTIFTDYLSSSYLIHAGYPNFRSFIDLRDYEIFTPAFFDTYANAVSSGSEFKKLDNQYHFNAVVLLAKQNDALHQYLYNDSVFHLVHLDAVCAVYSKTVAASTKKFTASPNIPAGNLAHLINHIFNPFYTYETETAMMANQEAASYFLKVHDLPMALHYTEQIKGEKTETSLRAELTGSYFLQMYQADTSAFGNTYLDSAEVFYKQAIKQQEENGNALFGLGIVHYIRKQYRPSVKYFEQVAELQSENLNARLYLASCYEKLADFGNADFNYQKQLENLMEAYRLNPENPFIETDLGITYYHLKECEQAIYYLEKIKNFEGLSVEDRDMVKRYIQNCK